MGCERCGGLLVQDHYIDMEDSGGLWIKAWRCICCGNVVDYQIVTHHALVNPSASKRNLYRRRKQAPLKLTATLDS
jgi:hypothetical protein